MKALVKKRQGQYALLLHCNSTCTHFTKLLISWYLQGKDGHTYEYAPKEVVCLPAGQLSILTLPRFLAVPIHWTEAATSIENSSAAPAAPGTSYWQMLQLSKDSKAANGASQTRAARLLSGTAFAPH